MLASYELVTPHLLTPESKANASPFSSASCCITIPPSPVVVDPEANLINLSATSKSSVCWKLAVPATVRFLLTVKSLCINTSCDKLTSPDDTVKFESEKEAIPLFADDASSPAIVKVWVPAVVSIPSPPVIVKVWVFNATVPVPDSPAKSKDEAIPVNPEPSPSNEH